MPEIESFGRPMIETYLGAHELKYLVDSDGDLVVQFETDENTGIEYTVFFVMREHIYAILFMGDRKIGKADWGRAVMACNEWNRDKRWPTAVLYIDQESGMGQIRLEGHLDLEQGIHQELFNDFTNYHVMGGAAFWDWVTKESKF